MTTRLVGLIQLAADNQQGMGWYANAKAEIETICRLEGWDADKFTAILAVTSPRVSVRRNIRITLHYMRTGEIMPGVIRSVRQSVATWESTGQIKGKKTSSFYRALRGDYSAIVLDTWMAKCLNVDQKLFSTKGNYSYYSGIVAGIAKILGIENADCQACLWYGAFGAAGRVAEPFQIMQEYRNWLGHDKVFPVSGSIERKDLQVYTLAV